MAKNELLKFASGDKPNLVPFSEWEANPSVKTGFQAGIAKSAELNRVFAQGALAAHTLGEFVVEMAKENVSLETDLYKSFKKALGAYVNQALSDGVIKERHLAGKAVGETKLADGSVSSRVIANNAVTGEKIAEKAIENRHLAVSSVGFMQLQTGSVRGDVLDDGAVTGSKIANGSITNDKLASTLDASKFTLKMRTVTTSERKRMAFKSGEIVMDTEENRLYIGDGSTAGGVAVGGGGGAPTGMVAMFHASQPPEGWLLCNGASVKQKDYADLFAVIGTTYGKGSGSDTFNLPNLNHRFLEGTTSSSEVGKYVEAGLPNITGTFRSGGHLRDDFMMSGAFSHGRTGQQSNSGSARDSCLVTFDASMDNDHYGKSATVQPASVRLLVCIRT